MTNPTKTTDNISAILNKIKNGDLLERRGAVKELLSIGADAVEPLVEFICSETTNDDKWYASSALAKIGAPAISELIFTLKTYPDDDVKRYCAAALAEIGEPAIAELIAVFEGDDSYARGFASKALIRIGEPAIPALTKFIRDTDPEEMPHRCAVITLEKMSETEPEGVQKAL